jgi:hypothetical protein
VACEVSGGISYPVLTKTNYSDWALLMKVKLKSRALWTIVEKGGTDVHEYMMALNMLCSAVPREVVSSIAKMETGKEAWEAIATMCVGDGRVRKSTTQQLRRKFDLDTCGDGETVEDYALHLNSLTAHLATLGEEVKESQDVENLLVTLPLRFKQTTIAIKTHLDVSSMGVADLTEQLKEAEEAFEEVPSMLQHEGKLYLTEE